MQSQSQYVQVVACIKKPPAQRTAAEARSLYPWLVNKSQLFKSLKLEVVTDILKNCEFSERKRDGVIIRQGDKGDRFYVILSGKVSVYINTEAVPDDPEEATVVAEESNDTDGGEKSEKKKELDRSLYGNYIASIDAGKSFGELALINKDCVRNASIIADELTHLLVVDRDLYNRSLRAAQEAEFQQRIDFVNGCSLFNSWPIRFKRQAAMSLRKESLIFDMPIVRQGEPINGLVFIKSGQAKVVVDIMMHYHQFPHLNLHEDPEVLERRDVYGELMDSAHEPRSDSNRKLWNKPLRRQGYAVAENRQAQRHLEISIIGTGEILGDIEQGLELSTYIQSVICTQPSEVYILDSKNYERLIAHKRNPGTINMLRKKAEMKVLSRMGRVVDRQIPLIRNLAYRILEAHRQHQEALKAQARSASPPNVISLLAEPQSNDFIPQRGPLIDHYGPGTVFYRNKMKRLAKIRAERMKNKTVLEAKGGGNRRAVGGVGAVFGGQNGEKEDDDEEDSSEDEGDFEMLAPSQRRQASKGESQADWETSEDHLIQLEERINGWLVTTSTNLVGHKSCSQPVAKLARFKKEEKQKIFPGKKIYLRPRHEPAQIKLKAGVNGAEQRAPKRNGSDDEDDNIFITEPRTTTPRADKRQNVHQSSQMAEDNRITDGLRPYAQNFRSISVAAVANNFDERGPPGHSYRSKTRFLPLSRLQTQSMASGQREGSRQNHHQTHQYTAEEYKALKLQLVKKQKELNAFRCSVSIF